MASMGRQTVGFNKALTKMAGVLNSNLTASEKLHLLVETTSQALGVRGCSLLLLDAQKKRLIHAVARGLTERYLRKGFVEADRSLSEVMEGKTVMVVDTATDPRVQFEELAQQERITSIMGVPLWVKGEMAGSLRVYSRTRREFTSDEEGFLITVANLAAMVLQSDRFAAVEDNPPMTETGVLPSSAAAVPTLRSVSFAHPSEEEFAHLLDFYQIEWVYEPRSFPVEWEEKKITEMFTPDFYLPGQDLYIEVTTLKPGLTRDKHRKLRRLRELYPEVNVKLLARRDYDRLLAKYGHGPLAGTKTRGVGRILLSTDQIQSRVRQMAAEVSRDYDGRHPMLVGVLRGVFCFMADLMRYLTVPADVDFMALSYYGSQAGGAVRITKDLDMNPEGRHVLLVEDIVDTGMTLGFILAHLKARHPASLAVCTLLDKKVNRLAGVSLDYVGFEVPDEFMVGYGLDYREEYRNLPFVALLREEKATPPPSPPKPPAPPKSPK
jgi:bifunctional protein TilS/HprT